MLQTDSERIARQNALKLAIENAPGSPADEIVGDAEKFRAFLTGDTKSEGND